ncbi:MAG: hypothetical protein A2Y00_00665 [Omnitrophica WOR_2 bacterium GWF2_43_52]|nr:MAG: hypothetical protein A2Y01_05740 [Omnitrophica WOR_2 bacterium GWC2_44_8]OGX20973.1 MAG: hypothetical protein A2Y00_00665 [Omnitrophica WOR_2 bacterium GWF2_43_52]OGX56814.1 MAG: hypothetical protein A2460_09830 [Omnitrophica WOR_2 bacterium RIFOXYC2_FULL_43_9]HAH21152.1 hypothetical protein [Candidatus Omnitrophota bacterium]HBG63246.1 hypothetical protein [Candidatus Omnitrophota bacterium]
MSNTQIIIRLLISVLVSGLIGLERQLHRRAAGLRTHILVCVGSTLIMLTSLYIFDIYKDKVAVDPSRIASGVITGIGFLGAGTIIRYGEEIRGLTTAASLWVVAALGLAVGCGFYTAAIATTVIVLLTLMFLRRLENKIFGDKHPKG